MDIDNQPNQYRKQHGQMLLMCDLALNENIIDSSQHSDVMFYLQMRDAFHSKSEGRDTVLGKMADGETGGGGSNGSSLVDKYSAFLREFDKVQQTILSILIMPEKPHGRLRHLQGMWNMKTEIRNAINAFSDWCHK